MEMTTRQQILGQISQAFGAVPGWLEAIPEPQLEEKWGDVSWFTQDTNLSSREKALVALGASRAIRCQY
jgi:alkylhydroperoxidase/carboxymuconolactone decarboxylase family protein YurZ